MPLDGRYKVQVSVGLRKDLAILTATFDPKMRLSETGRMKSRDFHGSRQVLEMKYLGGHTKLAVKGIEMNLFSPACCDLRGHSGRLARTSYHLSRRNAAFCL